MESVPVPAGEGDLAVAAKFALESIEVADSAAGLERRQRKKGDRSDSSDAGSSSDDDSSEVSSSEDEGGMPDADAPAAPLSLIHI